MITLRLVAITVCKFVLLEHPPYSPNLSLSDYHLFPALKRALSGHHFETDDEVMRAVEDCCSEQEPSFFASGIRALESRWEKCVATNGDYVEKQIKMPLTLQMVGLSLCQISASYLHASYGRPRTFRT